ncbi:sentrin-specific protease 5-like [Aphis gossypii]|uniref:Ubiquitin-like protease family profile domain-containing protein n=1 Tax=Aphis gossypii TaxID=80765 RepID=A0A9P0NMM4_APHGO|nr:sentrin-specific protease 5-like [Aphis gossypii]CAH1732014.1 unnamed protein product [Aphis gossypii]
MISNKRKAKEDKSLIEELTLDNYSFEDYIEGRDIENISVEHIDSGENLQNSHQEQTGLNLKSYFINSVVFCNVHSKKINACEINDVDNITVNAVQYDNKRTFRVFEVYKTQNETEVIETGVGQVQPEVSIDLAFDDEDTSNEQLPTKVPRVRDMGILHKIKYINTPDVNILFPGYSKEILLGIIKHIADKTLNEGVSRNEEVTINDLLKVFLPNVWLNDAVINTYFDLLVKQSKDKVLAFNTHFFEQSTKQKFTNVVCKKLKNIKLFEYSKIIIPIHLAELKHWALILIEPQAKTITYFDSLLVDLNTFNFLSTKISFVVGFLNIVYRAQERFVPTFTWKIKCGDSPLQNNMNDCGVFVCINARYIIFNQQINYSHEASDLLRQRITYEILSNRILISQ